jgi:FkbM family methyltransferase
MVLTLGANVCRTDRPSLREVPFSVMSLAARIPELSWDARSVGVGVVSRVSRAASSVGLGRQVRWLRSNVKPEPATARRERLDNEHLRLLMAFVLREDSKCIDVGAHAGAMLQDMAYFAPKGRHIAYEPIPEFYERLRSAFPSVDVRQAALSDADGQTSFNYVKNMPGMSGMHRRNYPREPQIERLTVRTERLDDHLPDGYVPDLIKIDVEGAEHLVLAGARHTILTHRPTLIVEYGRGSHAYTGVGAEEMYQLLAGDLGYRIFDLDGNGPYSRDEFKTTPYWQFVGHA